MKYISIFVCLIMIMGTAMAQPFRLMVYGDSLSAGYGLSSQEAFYSKLEKALQKQGYPNIVVINASKSGETTSGGLQRIPQALQKKPDAVLLELGINDALRNVPIETIQNNLQKMMTQFKQAGIPVFLIGMQIPAIQNPVYAQQFSRMYQQLAKKNNVSLYPFFMKGVLKFKMGLQGMDTTYLLSDNAHPNAKGIDIMVKNILPSVKTFLRKNGAYR